MSHSPSGERDSGLTPSTPSTPDRGDRNASPEETLDPNLTPPAPVPGAEAASSHHPLQTPGPEGPISVGPDDSSLPDELDKLTR